MTKPGPAVKIAGGRSKFGNSDLGSPADIGGAPPNLKRAAPPAPDIDPAEDDTSAASSHLVTPQAVNYHDEAQSCATCDHYGQDGTCAVLQMPVQPEGGCNAFSGGQDTDDDDDTGADDDSNVPLPGPINGARGGYGS